MNPKKRSEFFRTQGLKLGFDQIGFSKAEFMDEEAFLLEKWLRNNFHGEMTYMDSHFDMRVDPRKLFPGAKSVISLTYNYYNPQNQVDSEAPKISKYAYGKDYHLVIKKKLKELINQAREYLGDFSGRSFVDSAPILERDWAKRSGIGWIGKHTLLITKKRGSYFFLAEIICDLELDYDHPVNDHCGTCTRCITACPTDAISNNGYIVDASKCISYLTIELKNEIPSFFQDKMESWIFGCDICQEVCPWNRFAIENNEFDFHPKNELLEMTKSQWLEITNETFDHLFKNSAVKRTKYVGLKRNIEFVSSNGA